MYQAKQILTQLNAGDSMSVNTINSADDVYSTNYHTLIVLGSSDAVVTLSINGITMELCGGVTITRIPLQNVSVSAGEGVLLIGDATKRQLFD